MVRNILFLLLFSLLPSLPIAAQQTLNLHTTTHGTVSFAFATNPDVTFPEPEVIAVTTDSVTVQYPFSEVEKITLIDATINVASVTIGQPRGPIVVSDLSGRIVYRTDPDAKGQDNGNGKAALTLSISALPPGSYIVSDGIQTFKIIKRK